MNVSVGQVMRSVRNYFESGYRATAYKISGGAIAPDDLLREGMYIAITGSFYNDGVWKIGEGMKLEADGAVPKDENFYGRVYFLAPPADFLTLCESIAEFAKNTPVNGLQSESFGAYSMSRASGKSGGILTWEDAFANELSAYRNMWTEVL